MGIFLTNESVKNSGCGHLVKVVSLMLSPAIFNAVAKLLDDLLSFNPFYDAFMETKAQRWVVTFQYHTGSGNLQHGNCAEIDAVSPICGS